MSNSPKPSSTFDAGILFANESSYVCIPLEKLGIDIAKEIFSVKSSCQCVRPSVVRYRQRESVGGIALRLDFVEESKVQDDTSPSMLALEITFQFASGTEQSVTIQFLYTVQMDKKS